MLNRESDTAGNSDRGYNYSRPHDNINPQKLPPRYSGVRDFYSTCSDNSLIRPFHETPVNTWMQSLHKDKSDVPLWSSWMLTFSSHALGETFLVAAVLTPVALPAVNHALAALAAVVGEILPHGPLEEALAAFAGEHAVMLPGGSIPADDAPVPAAVSRTVLTTGLRAKARRGTHEGARRRTGIDAWRKREMGFASLCALSKPVTCDRPMTWPPDSNCFIRNVRHNERLTCTWSVGPPKKCYATHLCLRAGSSITLSVKTRCDVASAFPIIIRRFPWVIVIRSNTVNRMCTARTPARKSMRMMQSAIAASESADQPPTARRPAGHDPGPVDGVDSWCLQSERRARAYNMTSQRATELHSWPKCARAFNFRPRGTVLRRLWGWVKDLGIRR